jgi:hypothetical protein
VYPDGPSLAKLFISMLNSVGVDVDAFGDAQGALAGL